MDKLDLKVKFVDGQRVTDAAAMDVVRMVLVGKINNEPEFVRHIEMGQKYEFTEAQVTDWLFKRNGKMVGNETLRPLLKRMGKEEAAPYWAMYEKP